MLTFDRRTIDSTGAFLIGELERLDQTLHEPFATVTWARDVDLREDVTMGDEFSSFLLSAFAAPGGVVPSGKAWIGKDTNAIPDAGVDIAKTANRLHLWAMQLSYTIPELESSNQVGRPIDQQKYNVIKLKHQMDIDEQVYIGDSTLGVTGLVNSTLVTPTNAAVAGSSSPTGNNSSLLWKDKTPAAILADLNAALMANYTTTAFSVMPTEIRLPPIQFSLLASTLVSNAGNQSLLGYLRDNTVANAVNGRPVNIQPLKWLTGAGAGGTDRMLIYSKDYNRVRFPMVPLQRTPVENRSIFQITTYFGRLGQTEIVYPETIAYLDGI